MHKDFTIPECGTVIEHNDLAALKHALHKQGKKIAWTNGCFDILHAGHLLSLEFAAKQAEVLVVGINSDSSVRTLKGDSRPINGQIERARLVAALRCVCYTVIFEEPRTHASLRELQPDVFVKGGDYTLENMDQVERSIIEEYGGRIVFSGKLDGFSTTEIIEKTR